MEHKNYYQSYKDAGFFFPSPILTTYALSLYSKPFVILSGISGTGKTKIAQLFDINLPSDKLDKGVGVTNSKFHIKIPEVYDRFNFPKRS